MKFSKDAMKKTLRVATLAMLMALPISLSACGGATTSSSSDGAGSSSVGSSSTGSSATGAETTKKPSQPAAGGDLSYKSPEMNAVLERLNKNPEFKALSTACKATAVRMTADVALVLASFGKAAGMATPNPENEQKNQAMLKEVQGTTPAELDSTFTKIESGLTGTPEEVQAAMQSMENDVKPVGDWLKAKCNGFNTDAN